MKNTNSSSVFESKGYKNQYGILPYFDNKFTVNHVGYGNRIKGILFLKILKFVSRYCSRW